MALSATERKRLQVIRERKRAESQRDLTYDLPRPALGEWIEENCGSNEWDQLKVCYDGMNRFPPDLHQEHDPVSSTGEFVFPEGDDGAPSYVGALGRAELEVDLLIEAAKTLATMLNAYKRSVIDDRIAQIQEHELDDPETRGARMNEVIELTKALGRLDKNVRADIPQWQLRG